MNEAEKVITSVVVAINVIWTLFVIYRIITKEDYEDTYLDHPLGFAVLVMILATDTPIIIGGLSLLIYKLLF